MAPAWENKVRGNNTHSCKTQEKHNERKGDFLSKQLEKSVVSYKC